MGPSKKKQVKSKKDSQPLKRHQEMVLKALVLGMLKPLVKEGRRCQESGANLDYGLMEFYNVCKRSRRWVQKS